MNPNCGWQCLLALQEKLLKQPQKGTVRSLGNKRKTIGN